MPHAGPKPIIVSFFTDESYYSDAADLLRADCLRLKWDCDITQTERQANGWLDVCRRKIGFCLEMHRKHQRPILWLDVDSRLGRRPDIFDGATCDVAGFLRGFRYLRDFDPQSSPRFFSPFALYFNFTPRATAFLELMAQLEREHTGSATDDFFLQEAWAQHRDQLSIMVLPPDLIGREWPLTAEQMIYVGISGNVSKFKERAQQHVAEILAPERRKTVLLWEAEDARRKGDMAVALVLYKRALELAPDEALAQRIERLTLRDQRILARAGTPADEQGVAPAAAEQAIRPPKSTWKRWLSPRRSS